jgi:hypothetical protein
LLPQARRTENAGNRVMKGFSTEAVYQYKVLKEDPDLWKIPNA